VAFAPIIGFFTKYAAAISVAATVAGTAMQVAGSRQAAKSEAALYKYNEALNLREAQQRRTASLSEQSIRRDQMRKTLKRQRTAIAKGKIRMGGSALLTQLESVEIMSADIAMFAYGRELEATGLETKAGVSRFRAGAARQAGRLAVGTALVGGVSGIAKLGIKSQLAKQPGASQPYWKV